MSYLPGLQHYSKLLPKNDLFVTGGPILVSCLVMLALLALAPDTLWAKSVDDLPSQAVSTSSSELSFHNTQYPPGLYEIAQAGPEKVLKPILESKMGQKMCAHLTETVDMLLVVPLGCFLEFYHVECPNDTSCKVPAHTPRTHRGAVGKIEIMSSEGFRCAFSSCLNLS